MVSNFITPALSKASELGIGLYEDTDLIILWPDASLEEVETAIRAVYRQVLGNAYVMESERLAIPESQLKQGEITVREFVRQVAQSELYRSRFFDGCPRYRAIELNFKHLLGRAPESYQEMTLHSDLLDRGGYEVEIDSYLDSNEFLEAFGEDIVPYYRGYKTQTGKRMIGFTHLFKLLRGASSSDKNIAQGNYSRLNQSLITDTPSTVVPPSGIGTYGGLTDVNKLLAEVFKPKQQPKSPQQADEASSAQTADYQALQSQCTEQDALIEKLRSQLAELSLFASVGQSGLNKWQSKGSVTSSGSNLSSGVSLPNQATTTSQPSDYQSLQQRVEEQKQAIAALQSKIAESRSFASIGEARLNKWRGRTFF
ncbi:MAG: phycobilisome rod-core linker polypeptide [Microcystaceae cyanobacterium]